MLLLSCQLVPLMLRELTRRRTRLLWPLLLLLLKAHSRISVHGAPGHVLLVLLLLLP